MNFFEQQTQQRSRSRWLIWAFLGAVVLTAAAIDLLLLVAVRMASKPGDPIDDAGILMAGGVVVVAVILGASLWRSLSLREGGGGIMRGMGATVISGGGQGVQQQRLVNVVEEMAIAAGVPVPEIYVLEQESAINAFAAGYTTADAAVCVTQGSLDRLSRDELQGVIGHEFSHILNGDMRLNIRLMALVFGLVVVAWLGQMILRHSPREKEGAAFAVFGGLIWALGSIGLLFGRVIKASVSRAREYLADASSVQFTRQTDGLVGALSKAAGTPGECKLAAAQGEEVAHMLFGDGIGLKGLFATHPPLRERIRRLDPRAKVRVGGDPAAASGNDDEQALGLHSRSSKAPGSATQGLPTQGSQAQASQSKARKPGALPADTRLEAQLPVQASALVGHSHESHIELAEALRAGLPKLLRMAAHDRERAPDVLLALLIDQAPPVRARQLVVLGTGARAQSVRGMLDVIDQQAAFERLPLAQITFSALKQRPRNELLTLRGIMDELIHADAQVALFEYCMGKLYRQLLGESLDPQRTAASGQLRLSAARGPVSEVLSLAASLGTPGGATAAYRAAIQSLRLPLPAEPLLLPRWQETLDRALPVLDQLAPSAKAQLIDALSAVLGHDHHVSVPEAELLRTLCALIHCPLPPLLRKAA